MPNFEKSYHALTPSGWNALGADNDAEADAERPADTLQIRVEYSPNNMYSKPWWSTYWETTDEAALRTALNEHGRRGK